MVNTENIIYSIIIYNMTIWTDFVKSFAKEHNITYGCALSDPDCSAGYKAKYGVKKPLGKKKEIKSMMAEDINRVIAPPIKTPERKKKFSAFKSSLKQKQNKTKLQNQLVETMGMMAEDINRFPVQDIAGNFVPVAKKSKVGRKKGSKNKSKSVLENISMVIEEVKQKKNRGRPKKYATAEEARKAKIANTIASAKRRKEKKGGDVGAVSAVTEKPPTLEERIAIDFERARDRWARSLNRVEDVDRARSIFNNQWGELMRRFIYDDMIGGSRNALVFSQEEEDAEDILNAYNDWVMDLEVAEEPIEQEELPPLAGLYEEDDDEELPPLAGLYEQEDDDEELPPLAGLYEQEDITGMRRKREDEDDDELPPLAGLYEQGRGLFSAFNKIGRIVKEVLSRTNPIQSAVISGVSNIVRNPKAVIYGRNDFPPKVRKIISKYGNKNITGITLSRTPLGAPLMTALQIASGNTFSQKLSNTPYDKLFHLFICIVFADGSRIMLEKNEVINAIEGCKLPKETETKPISGSDIPTALTLSKALNNTKERMGGNFFTYSAKDNNCQDFIIAFLKSNKIGTETDASWVKQETKVLFEGNDRLRKIANTLTDIGARFDVIQQGAGVKKKKKKGGMIDAGYESPTPSLRLTQVQGNLIRNTILQNISMEEIQPMLMNVLNNIQGIPNIRESFREYLSGFNNPQQVNILLYNILLWKSKSHR